MALTLKEFLSLNYFRINLFKTCFSIGNYLYQGKGHIKEDHWKLYNLMTEITVYYLYWWIKHIIDNCRHYEIKSDDVFYFHNVNAVLEKDRWANILSISIWIKKKIAFVKIEVQIRVTPAFVGSFPNEFSLLNHII